VWRNTLIKPGIKLVRMTAISALIGLRNATGLVSGSNSTDILGSIKLYVIASW
jgi:hypothetical protein